jgi:putative hemolysin
MSGIWPQLALVGVLVLLNAAFAGSELALVSLREGQLQRLEGRSSRGTALARLARDPNRFLATIQIGITLAGFLASASAAVSLAVPLQEPLSFLGGSAEVVAIVIVTLILSYVTLVFGELAPKRIAMQRAEPWGLLVARPLGALSTATRPVVWFLSRSTDLVVRIFGIDPSSDRDDVTEEELRDMVAAQTSFSPEQRKIIDGAFEVSERTLHAVLRPRNDVLTLDSNMLCRDALGVLASSGHSRAPVSPGGDLDLAAGSVHLRDLLIDDPGCIVGDISNAMPVFPDSMHVLAALRTMQLERVQMAVVVDEHGGAEGIITVEDLVEELVGEIYDETDLDLASVRRDTDGRMVLSGRFPIHDLIDIGIDVPDGPYVTIAGFVIHELQHVPSEPGAVVEAMGRTFTVSAVDRRAITQVTVSPRRSDDGV